MSVQRNVQSSFFLECFCHCASYYTLKATSIYSRPIPGTTFAFRWRGYEFLFLHDRILGSQDLATFITTSYPKEETHFNVSGIEPQPKV